MHVLSVQWGERRGGGVGGVGWGVTHTRFRGLWVTMSPSFLHMVTSASGTRHWKSAISPSRTVMFWGALSTAATQHTSLSVTSVCS